jgi:hypothetical protein
VVVGSRRGRPELYLEMPTMKRIALPCLLIVVLLGSSLVLVQAWGQEGAQPGDRQKAAGLMGQGNWKEAYAILSKLAEDKADTAATGDCSRRPPAATSACSTSGPS